MQELVLRSGRGDVNDHAGDLGFAVDDLTRRDWRADHLRAVCQRGVGEARSLWSQQLARRHRRRGHGDELHDRISRDQRRAERLRDKQRRLVNCCECCFHVLESPSGRRVFDSRENETLLSDERRDIAAANSQRVTALHLKRDDVSAPHRCARHLLQSGGLRVFVNAQLKILGDLVLLMLYVVQYILVDICDTLFLECF